MRFFIGLSACGNKQTAPATLTGVREFDICPEALALPDPQRGFQGLGGWVFFNFDFRETYEAMTPEQAAFAIRLNRALAAQGVLLVVVPVPARGGVRPSALYLGDPRQAAFFTREGSKPITTPISPNSSGAASQLSMF